MWKQLKIDDRTYFKNCCLNGYQFEFYMFDLKDYECYSEVIDRTTALQRMKDLNKNIYFDIPIMREVLVLSDPVKAMLRTRHWANCPPCLVLRLKYVYDDFTINYEWYMTVMDTMHFRNLIIEPLLEIVQSMAKQIGELRDNVHKKDLEIEHYKKEGILLRCPTIVTKPFDFYAFDKGNYEANIKIKGFLNIADYVHERDKRAQRSPTRVRFVDQIEGSEASQNTNGDIKNKTVHRHCQSGKPSSLKRKPRNRTCMDIEKELMKVSRDIERKQREELIRMSSGAVCTSSNSSVSETLESATKSLDKLLEQRIQILSAQNGMNSDPNLADFSDLTSKESPSFSTYSMDYSKDCKQHIRSCLKSSFEESNGELDSVQLDQRESYEGNLADESKWSSLEEQRRGDFKDFFINGCRRRRRQKSKY